MKKIIGKILMLIGFLIILTGVMIKIYTRYKENEIISEYRDLLKNENEKNINNIEKNKNNNKNQVLGIINIPKIELNVAIEEGTDEETLKYSVGHFKETAGLGQNGNCCIIGHRSYTYGEYFNRLDELENGDKVIITQDKDTYTYEIIDKFVVEPEDVWVLNDSDDYQLTLITCTPIRIATHRLIIRGKLI